MRFHILGLSHTKTTKEYSPCAFTQKVRLLCKMLHDLGHEVYHYGTAGSNPECTENVEVLSEETWSRVHGDRDWKRDGFNVAIDTPAMAEFTRRAQEEIRVRASDHDFLLCTFGHAHQPIAQYHPNLIAVESGIGYPITFAKYRVFESYAWMHFHYGKEGRDVSPEWYDAVIPNYIDIRDYPFIDRKQPYFIFIGRFQNRNKGALIASQVCERLGVDFYYAGQGQEDPEIKGKYLGVLTIEERAFWVSHAKGFFCPTYYVEPFGTVAIEAMAYGTPVITTDFGAFTETVVHGKTGYRCRTFEQFVWAAQNIEAISPSDCRAQALKYSLPVVADMYHEYFQNLERLYQDSQGWYFMPVTRTRPWTLTNGVR